MSTDSAPALSESTPVRLSLVIAVAGVLVSIGGMAAVAADTRSDVTQLQREAREDATTRATLAAEVKALTRAVDRLEARLAKE